MATFGKSRRFQGNPPETPPPGAYNPKRLDHTPSAVLLGRGRDKNCFGHFDLTLRKSSKSQFCCSTPRSLRPPSSLAKSRRLSRSTPSLHSRAASSIVISNVSGSSDYSLGDDHDDNEMERAVDLRASFRLQLEEISRLTADNQRLKQEKEEAKEQIAQLAMEVEELRMEIEFWEKIERKRYSKLPTPMIAPAAEYGESKDRNNYGRFMAVLCAGILYLLKTA